MLWQRLLFGALLIAGLDDEAPALVEAVRHRAGHAQLRGARLVRGEALAEQPARTENGPDRIRLGAVLVHRPPSHYHTPGAHQAAEQA